MSQRSTADDTMTSEAHDQEVEEYIWAQMGTSGLLSELKAQIAQFVQNNGKTNEAFSVDASRADPEILAMIYEYLNWVGLKNTCVRLLSESPVTFETAPKTDAGGEKVQIPQLCSLLAKDGGAVESKLKPLKNASDDLCNASISEHSKFSLKQTSKSPVHLIDIESPWAKSNSVDPNIEDESISDLLDSTAEDVTQDLSVDSDSKVLAANLNECDHHVKLK